MIHAVSVTFLGKVPSNPGNKWSTVNGCFQCHPQGFVPVEAHNSDPAGSKSWAVGQLCYSISLQPARAKQGSEGHSQTAIYQMKATDNLLAATD